MEIGKCIAFVGYTLVTLTLCACNNKTPTATAVPIAAPFTTPAKQTVAIGTQIGNFKPDAGTVNTLGFDDLGGVSGTTVQVREISDSKGYAAKGLRLDVVDSYQNYSRGAAFIDDDEVDELIKGINTILEVKTNPTSFKNFQVQYKTRGDFELTAFSDSKGALSYSVKAGQANNYLTGADMEKLRNLFVVAQERLNVQSAKKK